MRRPPLRSTLALLIALACGGAAAAEPITMDGAYLAIAKARTAAGDATVTPALRKLLLDADALLTRPSEAVTNKTMVPPSGNKHDYLSLAPYWWPDPHKPGGLPYVQRDGEFNPSAKNAASDSVRMQYMCHGVEKLALAYYFTGKAEYARKAAEAIRTWFLDPATLMKPSLRYGQAVLGKVEGRGTGLIDTRNLWMVADAAALIGPSGSLSEAETASLRRWFGEFAEWMQESKIGMDEAGALNNHGMYYDMQLADFYLFAGERGKAKAAVQHALDARIQAQVMADGSQPRELARTTPFHYSAFNLDAMTTLARYGEQLGVDVWHAQEEGRGVRRAIDYLVPYAAAPSTWPHKELRGVETELMLPILLRAERAYGSGAYARAAAALPRSTITTVDVAAAIGPLGTAAPSTVDTVDRLLWPVK
jgi:hypothetical protein